MATPITGSLAATPTPPTADKYTATIYPVAPDEIPSGFADCILRLQAALKMPVWFLIQPGGKSRAAFSELDTITRQSLCSLKNGLLEGQRIALVVDCPGGDAKAAYQIARFLRLRCGGFWAIVPEWAKSAATLLVLGADRVILGKNAELGPLDAQIYDPDREQRLSALDEVQALERLNAFALQALDTHMAFLRRKTNKTFNALLPGLQHFTAEMLRPLFEKVETVHYTQMSRMLKVAEDYAVRLLQPKYTLSKATDIARCLVHQFPGHEFFIGLEETREVGLGSLVKEPSAEVGPIMDDMVEYLQQGATLIGRLEKLS